MKKNHLGKLCLLVMLSMFIFVTCTQINAAGMPVHDPLKYIYDYTQDIQKAVKVAEQLRTTYDIFTTSKESTDNTRSQLTAFATALGSESMVELLSKDPKVLINIKLSELKKKFKTKGRDILGSSADKIVPERKDTSDLTPEEQKITSNTVAVLSGDDISGGKSNNPGMRLYLRKKMYDDVTYDMQAKYSDFFVNPKTGKQVNSPIEDEASVYKFIKNQHKLLVSTKESIKNSESNSTMLSQMQVNNQLMLMQIQISLLLLEAQADMNRLKLIETSKNYDDISDTVDSYLKRK